MNYEDIPIVTHPDNMKITLFRHQLASIYKMERLEQEQLVEYNNYVKETKLGINADIAGYGKTYSMIGLIIRDKMEWDVTIPFVFEKISTESNGLIKKRIIEPIKKKEPLLPIFNILKNKTIDINTARVVNTTNDDETIKDNTKTVTTQNTENRNFFNLMLGSFIISIFGFMVIFFLFGLNPFTWLLPIFFLIIMLIEGLKTRFPGSNNPLQPKRNFLNLIGWIILFYACYRLMSNGFAIKSALLALLGLGFILLSRTGRLLKFIGGLFSFFAIIALLSQFNFFNPKKGTKKDDNIEYDNTDEDKWDYKPEEVTDTIYSKEKDTIAVTYLKHNLKWNDNNQNPHQALLLVRKDYFNIANIKRNQLEIKSNDFREYYHQIYSNLILLK